jgi:hypothetical protein
MVFWNVCAAILRNKQNKQNKKIRSSECLMLNACGKACLAKEGYLLINGSLIFNDWPCAAEAIQSQVNHGGDVEGDGL